MRKKFAESLFGIYHLNTENPNSKMDNTLIAMFLLTYTIVIFLQASLKVQYIQGILAQVQMIASVFIVMRLEKKGVRASVTINGIYSISLVLFFLIKRNPGILPGVFVPISTIFISLIIYYFHLKIKEKYLEIEQQKNAYMNIYNQLIENQEKMQFQVDYDQVTNIANRNMVFNYIEKYVEINPNLKKHFSILIFDIEDFKYINNQYSHKAGDQVLKVMAARLKDNIDDQDFLGRLGGDEFVVFVQHTVDKDALEIYAMKLQKVIKSPLILRDLTFGVNTRVGIARYPEDTSEYNKILPYAETALMISKREKKQNIVFFDSNMEEVIEEKMQFSLALKSAIENKELYVMYQPQFEVAPKRIRGFEVLARWNSPIFGQVSPIKFIHEAEENGCILELGEWVLRTACQRILEIKKAYICEEGILSINISPLQLHDPSFLKMIKDVLEEYGIEGKELEFEITESIFMKPTSKILDVLHILRSMGIRIALDDFGTGYSSLNYLQKLPVDVLKIDKSFIDNIDQDTIKLKMVENIIKMAHDLSYIVVAEGVEEAKQIEALIQLQCDYIQGYVWGKPLNLNEMNRVLSNFCKEKKKK